VSPRARERQTTGSKQLIPFTPETSRMEWADLWGRRWAQPVRSAFVDAAPVPAPLRNFQMTTTFEVVNPSTGARVMHWQSDQNMLVRVHVKLLNNYQKYFEITNCVANQVRDAPLLLLCPRPIAPAPHANC
jgi:hypothetical protein